MLDIGFKGCRVDGSLDPWGPVRFLSNFCAGNKRRTAPLPATRLESSVLSTKRHYELMTTDKITNWLRGSWTRTIGSSVANALLVRWISSKGKGIKIVGSEGVLN